MFPTDQEDMPTGAPMRVRLKWFNASKGFGFVTPEDNQGDAFLHVSVLNRAGLQDLGDDAELICELGPGQRGRQVVRITEVISTGNKHMRDTGGFREPRAPRAPRSTYGAPRAFQASSGPEEEAVGTVKWFKPDKGFGFITADGASSDVFVHVNTLHQCGLNSLETGQRVKMRIRTVEKGKEAVWIASER